MSKLVHFVLHSQRKGPQFCSLLKEVNFKRGATFRKGKAQSLQVDNFVTKGRYKKPSNGIHIIVLSHYPQDNGKPSNNMIFL